MGELEEEAAGLAESEKKNKEKECPLPKPPTLRGTGIQHETRPAEVLTPSNKGRVWNRCTREVGETSQKSKTGESGGCQKAERAKAEESRLLQVCCVD